MNNTSQELDQDKKKNLLQQYLKKLFSSDPTLYYASTSDIAHNLYLMIKEHKNRMSVEEQALFNKITVEEIEMLLSFH